MICNSNAPTAPTISTTIADSDELEVVNYEVDDDYIISAFEDPLFKLGFDNLLDPNENLKAYALASKIFSDGFLNLDEGLVVDNFVEVVGGVGAIDKAFAKVEEEDLKEINEVCANCNVGVGLNVI